MTPSTDDRDQPKAPSAAELKAAREALERADAALASAEAEASGTAARVEEVSAELAELRGRLADLEEAEAGAIEAARVAERRLGPLRDEAARRKRELADLTRA